MVLFSFQGHAEEENQRYISVQNIKTSLGGLPSRSIRAISQDQNGFLWIASNNGVSRYDGYNFRNYHHDPDVDNSLSENFIKQIYIDPSNNIWAVTGNSGLNLIRDKKISRFTIENGLSSNLIFSISGDDTGLWIGTDAGLNFLDFKSHTITKFNLFDKTKQSSEIIQYISNIDEDKLLINANRRLFIFHIDSKTVVPLKTKANLPKNNIDVNAIEYYADQLWVAARQGLFTLDLKVGSFSQFGSFPKKIALNSLQADGQNGLLIGSHRRGLYYLNEDLEIVKLNFLIDKDEFKNDSIFSLYKDHTDKIWVGTFYNGLVSFTHNADKFNLTHHPELICNEELRITSLVTQVDKIYIGTNSGVFVLNKKTNSCNRMTLSDGSRFSVKSMTLLKNDLIAINTSKGTLIQALDTDENTQKAVTLGTQNTFFFLKSNGSYIQGTKNGLYKYPTFLDEEEQIDENIDIPNFGYISYARTKNNILLASTHGIFQLKDNKVTRFSEKNTITHSQINSIYVDSHIWAGKQAGGLLKLDLDGNLIKAYTISKNPNSLVIYNILGSNTAENGDLWLSTNQGLYRFDQDADNATLFTTNDGLLNNNFVRGAAHTTSNGTFLFGSSEDFISFHPDQLISLSSPPKIVLSKLTRFNKEVLVGDSKDEFNIPEPIEKLKDLVLSHKDYVIGFEFAGLHYADPARNQYAYMLDGFHEDWIHTDASNRTATFTNLSPGEYVFRVKAANKDGVWSIDEDNVALKIKVHPAPWFSWWAYTIYSLLFFASLFAFIRYRTKAANLRALQLEEEVKERTLEINQQKTMIENLLKRKDQLFANISHEFRTPLTLILGPLEKELQSLSEPKDPKTLQMIQRNAHRLMGMVEQILKLTELKNQEHKNKVPYALDNMLLWIVESFQPLAKSKNIHLSVSAMSGACVLASHDALNVMFGNLISNAIKYTPAGGNVSIGTHRIGQQVSIYVRDSGVGMTESQQAEVFERFVRLDKTSDIAGTGIGLSIVKELVDSHDGDIRVQSHEEQGSTFTITLPLTDIEPKFDGYATKAIEHLIQVNTLDSNQTLIQNIPTNANEQKHVVLIIDDNADMRSYVSSVLDDAYQCITSDRGQQGLEMAQQYVPDIIICDVMMPGMDGYEVTRLLRSNIVTSHIPIVLLTAKGDKQSRIQGWNENIDDYMTKPFDEIEILARVQNLISLRKIISSRVSDLIKLNNQTQGTSITSNVIDAEEKILNKKEQSFIDRFYKVISENYSDIQFQKNNFVASMHISERQLHRKIKALTDKTPMELLREYRLQKATEFLLDGETVTRTMELCGYNSASNFSRSFKAMYDVSPKQYQQDNHKGS